LLLLFPFRLLLTLLTLHLTAVTKLRMKTMGMSGGCTVFASQQETMNL